MTPIQSIKTCAVKYVEFSGRATRSEFWWFILITLAVTFALIFVDATLFEIASFDRENSFSPLAELFGLAVFIPSISVLQRRIQDTGRNARPWIVTFIVISLLGYAITIFELVSPNADLVYSNGYAFMGFLVLAALIAIIVATVKPSEPRDNIYGPKPDWINP